MGLLDKIFGSSNAKRRDLSQATSQAQATRATGLRRFGETTREGISEATAGLVPGANLGLSGLERFAAGVGASGRDEQQEFFDDFVDDPGFVAEQENAERAILRAVNAAGSLDSGATREAIARQGLLARRDATNNRLAQLLQLAQLGQTDRSNVAAITERGFNRIGDAEFGTSQQDAAGQLALGQAFADSRGLGVNNLVNLLTAAAKAGKGFA